jgi:hypothetical protein
LLTWSIPPAYSGTSRSGMWARSKTSKQAPEQPLPRALLQTAWPDSFLRPLAHPRPAAAGLCREARTMITPEQFNLLLLPACEWAEEQESIILRRGVPLTTTQLADARCIGITHSDRVRLHVVEEVPSPRHPDLRRAAEMIGLLSPMTIGLTLRYGIMIRSDYRGERRLVVHELVHTLQYERLGGFMPFLRQYLHECITIGYPAAPMEQEAKRIEREMCG